MNSQAAMPLEARVGVPPLWHLVVPAMLAASLAVLPLVRTLFAPWMVLDWTDSVEQGAVGLAEAVVVLTWLRLRGSEGGHATRLPRLWTIALWAWIAAMFAAALTARGHPLAVVRTAEWAGHLLFASVVFAEATMAERRAPTMRAVEAGGVGGMLVVFAAVGGAWLIEGGVSSSRDWMYDLPLVGGVRWLSIAGLAGLTLGAAGLLETRASPVRQAWTLAAVTIGWMMVWWGASRALLGGAVLASGLLVVGSGGRAWRVAILLTVAAVLGALLAAPVALPGTPGLIERLFGRPDGESLSEFGSGRSVVWGTVWDAWRARPWLGVGPGASVPLLTPVGNGHAHNWLLQALLEWGVVGAAAFTAVLVGLGARVLRQARSQTAPAVRAAGACLTAGLAAGLLDGLTSDPATTALLAVSAAVVLSCGPRGDTDRVSPDAMPRWRAVAAWCVVTVMVMHLATLAALWAPSPPDPESARVRWVQAFPSHPHVKQVELWGRAWRHSDPRAAAHLAEWGLATERSPWLFLRLRADLRLDQGDAFGARVDFRRAHRMEARARAPLLAYRAFVQPAGAEAD